MKNYNLKEVTEKGITLLALVVTVIILLILAGVIIKLALEDGGVLSEARQATSEWDKASEDEKSELRKLAEEMRRSRNGTIGNGTGSGGTGSGDGEDPNNPGGSGTGGGENLPTGNPGQSYTETTKVNIDGKPVTIPGGATISGLDSEKTVDGGLVIYIIPEGETVNWSNEAEVTFAQKTYSQFVWVPVENAVLDLSEKPTSLATNETIFAAVDLEISRGKYYMAVKDNNGKYFGIPYTFAYNETDNKIDITRFTGWNPLESTNREPSLILTGVSHPEQSTSYMAVNGVLNTGYNSMASLLDGLQAEYNDMVESVQENYGFWIGRYQTSGMSQTTGTHSTANEVKVNSVKGATNGTSGFTWYQEYAQQRIYSKLANIKYESTMIWSAQWDQMMLWMKNLKNTSQGENSYYILNSTGMENDITALKNIYNLMLGATTGCRGSGGYMVSSNKWRGAACIIRRNFRNKWLTNEN